MKKIHADIRNFLKEQGLTDTETTLYVSGLEHGPQTVTELSKRTGIKRTTTHSAISNLLEKGLMGTHTQAGSNYYTATDPNLIERTIVEKMNLLKNQQLDFINLLPLFEDLSNKNVDATEISSFTGNDGVRTAVDAALYCRSRQWKIIAPNKNFFSDGDEEYANYFTRTRKKRGIKAQSIWEPSFISKRTFDKESLIFRNPRILPKQLDGKFKSTLIIFDDSVLFVNSAKEASAVLIRSKEIASTMEVFFDGLWHSSKPLPKRKQV